MEGETNTAEQEEDFADLSIMACLLCQRKFKTLQDLQRHQNASELHKVRLVTEYAILQSFFFLSFSSFLSILLGLHGRGGKLIR